MLTNQLQMCMPLDFLTYKILHTDPPFGPSNKPNPSPPPSLQVFHSYHYQTPLHLPGRWHNTDGLTALKSNKSESSLSECMFTRSPNVPWGPLWSFIMTAENNLYQRENQTQTLY